MNKKEILSTCYICGKKFNTGHGCSNHIINFHIEYRDKNKRSFYFLKYIQPLALINNCEHEFDKNITNKCRTCGEETEFISFSKGFKKYCCKNCRYNNKKIIEKRKQTCLDRYGVDNPFKDVKKIKKSVIKKYGVDNPMKDIRVKEKSKQTSIKKYGVEHHMKSKQSINKIKDSWKNKSEKEISLIINKRRQTIINKYGVQHQMHINSIKEKVMQTCLCKYGVENYFVSKEFLDKNYSNQRSDEIFEKFKKNLINFNYKVISYEETGNISYKYNIIKLKHISCGKEFIFGRSNICKHIKYDCEQLCPHCYPRDKSSLKEQEIISFIKKISPGTKIITNSRNILPSGKELDICMPEHNFAIEFNGMYWHSDIFKDKNYHLDKTKECENLGIHLIHIFENEWLNKKTIIKYKILNKLKLIRKRIHTRKCEVMKLESKKEKELARRFLDIHHIQGRDNSSIYYGLVYNNKVVAIMSFIKSRRAIFGDKNKNKNIELVRFASHLKYNIPGAASRLLKHFERDNKEGYALISYAHRRLTNINNNLYKKLGFKLNHISKPGYYYFDGKRLRHRYNFRKSVLVEMGYDKDLTEFEITDMMGLLRIWDCGQLIYIKNYKAWKPGG